MAGQHSPLQQLRQAQQQRWLTERRQAIAAVLADADGADSSPGQVLFFGSRARGDWDGYSDTDLLVVAPSLLRAGVGDDVIPIALADWQAAAHSPSPSGRSIHAQAIPLDVRPSPGLEHGFFVQASDHASQAAEKAPKSLVLELGAEPQHTHVLGQLLQPLTSLGVDTAPLEAIPLRQPSRMSASSRSPIDATPPAELLDRTDAQQAIAMAQAVLKAVAELDRSGA